MENKQDLLPSDTRELTAEIVAAFVGQNKVTAEELPGLIMTVYRTLEGLGSGETKGPGAQAPAVPIRSSVRRNHIVCLEDGYKFRSLKRHLKAAHGLKPEEYRAKWGLRRDYPMVAPAYSAERAAAARAIGLGKFDKARKRGKRARKQHLKTAA